MSRGPFALTVAAALACGLLAGCAPAAPPPAAPAAPTTTVVPAPLSVPVDAPVRVRIPAIGVDGPVVRIATDAGGVLVPPPTTDVVGWFAAGPAPGDAGPALLAAHVDSRAGPGVFYRLRDLEPGDRIEIDRAGGATTAFTVVRRTQTAEAAFPTDLVYDPHPAPELRVVTCGGTFDAAARSYRDNIVIEAVAASSTWTVGAG